MGRDAAGRFSLHLRLPRLSDASGVEGELRIQSALGVKTLSAMQLLRPQFIPLSPQVPLVNTTGSDDMEEAAAAIEQDVSAFRAVGNFFAGHDSGRLLAPEEPLEWGETYRIMSQRPPPPAPSEISCEFLSHPNTKGWLLYELRLPAMQEGERIERAITHFTGRAMRMARPRIYIIDPMPHHIDVDGTYVYPAPPTRLLLRCTERVSIDINGSVRSEGSCSTESGEWIVVRGLQVGEASIRRDGQLLASIRIENCPAFEPQGVEISTSSGTWKLFDIQVRSELEKASSTISIQSPTTGVADVIALNPSQWKQRGNQHVLLDGVQKPIVDADNFGRITWGTPQVCPSVIGGAEQATPLDAAAKTWIEGLVQRVAGPAGIAQLKPAWEHRQYSGIPVLSRHPWLRAYVAAASGRNPDE